MGRFINTIERWSNLLGTWLIIFLMVLVCADVIYRTLFSASIIGAIELSEMIMIGVCSLTLAFTQNERGHVRMELFIGKLKGRTRQVFEFTAVLLCFLFVILVFIMTVISAKDSIAIMEIVEGISELPLWPWKTLIPIGFFLLCIRLMIQLIKHLKLILIQPEKRRD